MGEGPEFNPQIATVIHGMNITGIDDDTSRLNPSLDQYEMRPGQHAVVVGTKAEVDSEFTVVTLLDPKEYVDRFPDYQERLRNKHVLTKWYCSTEQDGQLGWYPLVRLIPIQEEEQFEFLMERIKEMDATGSRSKIAPPDWLKEAFSTYMEALSQVQPDTIPIPAKCKNCGSREVEIHGRKTSVIAAPAGVITSEDGDEKYRALREPIEENTYEIHLHCTDCDYRARFNPHEEHEMLHALGVHQH